MLKEIHPQVEQHYPSSRNTFFSENIICGTPCPQPEADIRLAISRFPSTRYYGSKRRLLPWIYEVLNKFHFETALDAFGGTASVSLLMLAMGKKVTFHDTLLFNKIAAETLLKRGRKNSGLYEDFSNIVDNISPQKSFIYTTFDGMYYTKQENAWLDGAAQEIHKLEPGWMKNALLYCLFQACLMKRPFNLFHRANLNLRLRKVDRSFHNHITWETPFQALIKRTFLELDNSTKLAATRAKILPCNNVSELRTGYDLVYLDPPYISPDKHVDDYLKRYHFLEGLARYEEWPSLIDTSSSIRALRSQPHIKQWQDKRFFQESIFDLISHHRSSIVVLSYIADGYPTENDLLKHFKKLFRKVHIYRKSHIHVLAKTSKKEILLVGEPKNG